MRMYHSVAAFSVLIYMLYIYTCMYIYNFPRRAWSSHELGPQVLSLLYYVGHVLASNNSSLTFSSRFDTQHHHVKSVHSWPNLYLVRASDACPKQNEKKLKIIKSAKLRL